MQQTEQTNDFLVAFMVGARQARERQQPDLRGMELLQIAVRDFHHAKQSLNLNTHEFLRGWACGLHAYYMGIVSEREVTE